MKPTRFAFLLTLLISLPGLLTIHSCSKTEPIVAQIPTVETAQVTGITETTATAGGDVSYGGGITVKARGVCWSTTPAPTTASAKTEDGSGLGVFVSALTGLSPNTLYYVRAYATNNLGTAYGTELTFTTKQEDPGTVTDFDGNVYHPVIIGSQVWLKENLKTTKYHKGEVITNVPDGIEWSTLTKGAYCDYDKNPVHSETYGRLYNWHAVNDSRNICPAGWHVPTDNEWQALMDYLGGELVAGGPLKATGTLGQGNGLWQDPNAEATNASGFSALPGGMRDANGTFSFLSMNAVFWSSSPDLAAAWSRELSYKYGNVDRYSRNQNSGFSVRCIKDN